MARKKSDDPPSEQAGEDATKKKKYQVTIDEDLVRKIRILAAADNLLPPAWINNHLRRLIRDTWRATMQELDEE